MTEALTLTEKSKKQRDNTKNATKNFDYTTIADRLRTVSWGSDSHPSGVVKPVYGIPTFPLTAKAEKTQNEIGGCLTQQINALLFVMVCQSLFYLFYQLRS